MIWKLTLFLIILLLPLQLGRHFWPDYSYIFGLRIDYLSPTIYLQDIFILFLAFQFLYKNKNSFYSFKKYLIYFFLIFGFILLNILFSFSKPVSLYSWIRFFELAIFGIIVFKNSTTVRTILNKILSYTIIFEFVIGLLQTIKGSSLGGILWLFGERNFNVFTPGIARATWENILFLRPYGTFSHPNSLSGFILVCLILLLGKKNLNILDKIALILGLILIILTFSRVVWLTTCILGLGFLLLKIKKSFVKKDVNLSFPYLLIAFSLPVMFYFFSRSSIDQSSIQNRLYLADVSFSLIRHHFFTGVGLGNFTIALSQGNLSWSWLYFLQPVHNIFLLLFSEIGIFGIIFLVLLIIWPIINIVRFKHLINWSIILAILSVLFTGFFDHYWLTLIQSQLLFALLLGLLWASSNGKINE